ncbi:hypothetical protein Zmor_010203 [Zophobas morio]|uniref:Uncharacterized protein n=1 Tax=Zophobas morio TaxID=2755281 RepID=A0AA38IIE0_9CUCU|nr:hypothetical protein Zmor_010203 [Zophobas morio]
MSSSSYLTLLVLASLIISSFARYMNYGQYPGGGQGYGTFQSQSFGGPYGSRQRYPMPYNYNSRSGYQYGGGAEGQRFLGSGLPAFGNTEMTGGMGSSFQGAGGMMPMEPMGMMGGGMGMMNMDCNPPLRMMNNMCMPMF